MQNKVFVLISPKNRTAYNFRGELITEIIKRGYKVYVTGPNKIDIDKIEALGANFFEIPNDKNGISVIADLCYFFRLYSFLRKVKPTVTLGYTIKPVIYGSLAARLAGVRSVNAMITGVGYLFISTTYKAKVLKTVACNLYKIALASAEKIIFQNQDDSREFIANKLVKQTKVHLVNGSGINMTKFLRTSYPEKLTFFMLSRMMHSKGVAEYLEASKAIKARYPEIRCIILGAFEGIQDSISEEIVINQYVDTGIVEYFCESCDVVSFYRQCSVYVLPSYREGTPRTVLEAMSMGRPIITTDTPGCNQTVVEGETGFLIPPKNVQALVEKMEYFILNPGKVSEMGEKSYRYCANKFEVGKVNKDMISIMEI